MIDLRLDTVRELGRGSEGTATLVRNRHTGAYYVGKNLRRYTLLDGQPEEVRIRTFYMPLHHRSLLELPMWYFVAGNSSGGCKIYYEYCAGGDLSRLIPRDAAEHPESFIWHVFIQLAEALNAMHNGGNQRTIHRDVKPENIFLKWPYRRNHPYPTIKLGDYGLATTMEVSNTAGTWQFIGPEIQCSTKGDVWALGAVIHELCHGFGPVSTAHRHWERDPSARRPRVLSSFYSTTLNNRMMSCLRVNPGARPDSAALVTMLHDELPRFFRY